MAGSSAKAGRGQVGHTKGVGSSASVGLREQRAGVRERDFSPFLVVPQTKTPETQVITLTTMIMMIIIMFRYSADELIQLSR